MSSFDAAWGSTGAPKTWELDVAGAVASSPSRGIWLEELQRENRVPRALWNDHMFHAVQAVGV